MLSVLRGGLGHGQHVRCPMPEAKEKEILRSFAAMRLVQRAFEESDVHTLLSEAREYAHVLRSPNEYGELEEACRLSREHGSALQRQLRVSPTDVAARLRAVREAAC
jgi:hypothetical protein